MDERERRGAGRMRSGADTPRRKRPDRYAHGPSGGGSGRRQPGRLGQRKEAAEPGEDDGMQSSGGLYLLY